MKKCKATNYQRGRRFEYLVKDYYEKKGYFVGRFAGSRSPFDLIALKEGEILLIQCKKRASSKTKKFYKDFFKLFYEKYKVPGLKLVFVFKNQSGKKEFLIYEGGDKHA